MNAKRGSVKVMKEALVLTAAAPVKLLMVSLLAC